MRIDQKYNSKKLMVIISDRLTSIINKGEITERYYNPGNYFEEVHIVLLNDDNPDINILKPTVGDARLKIYNLKKPNIFLSLFYNTFFIKSYVSKAFVLVKDINPLIIRTHNNFLEGYLAHRIKLKFKISPSSKILWTESQLRVGLDSLSWFVTIPICLPCPRLYPNTFFSNSTSTKEFILGKLAPLLSSSLDTKRVCISIIL